MLDDGGADCASLAWICLKVDRWLGSLFQQSWSSWQISCGDESGGVSRIPCRISLTTLENDESDDQDFF